MADTRDPRGIVNFFVRYLVLHVIFLVGLSLSYAMGLALFYFFGFIGFFTFFQVLIAVTRKFLDKAGWWKPVAIVGAGLVLPTVGAVLWWLGSMLEGTLDGSSEWWLVTAWLPYHFVAAFFAWGLREIFHWLNPQETTTTSTSASPVEPGDSENLSDFEDVDSPTSAPANTEANSDTDGR